LGSGAIARNLPFLLDTSGFYSSQRGRCYIVVNTVDNNVVRTSHAPLFKRTISF